jgi:hypothetical protein
VFSCLPLPQDRLWGVPLPHPHGVVSGGTVSMEVERPESEAKPLGESSVEVKNYWSYVTTPQ